MPSLALSITTSGRRAPGLFFRNFISIAADASLRPCGFARSALIREAARSMAACEMAIRGPGSGWRAGPVAHHVESARFGVRAEDIRAIAGDAGRRRARAAARRARAARGDAELALGALRGLRQGLSTST